MKYKIRAPGKDEVFESDSYVHEIVVNEWVRFQLNANGHFTDAPVCCEDESGHATSHDVTIEYEPVVFVTNSDEPTESLVTALKRSLEMREESK